MIADLTPGSLPSGITVTTAFTDIAGNTTVSTPGITLAGAGSGIVATTPFIDGGGALRSVNTDNEAAVYRMKTNRVGLPSQQGLIKTKLPPENRP